MTDRITALYIRFFRSFNFDYLRKASDTFKPDPWDILDSDDLKYPFVKVSLEQGVRSSCPIDLECGWIESGWWGG